MAFRIKPVKPKLISDQVYEQLRDSIFRGDLKPGDQLMPERELAAALGVSRPTLKGAINKLVVMGLLEQKQGQGTFVRVLDGKEDNPLAPVFQVEDATLEDLLEVRMGLECNAASLAALRANENDIRIMEENREEMELEVKDGKLGTESDVAFHMTISYATRNPVQIYIMRNFYDYLFVGIHENLRHLYEEPENIEKILDQHKQIHHAIRDHDQNRAVNAMHAHIQFVLDFLHSREGKV